jgi:diguanylate cyclase (GGDEF)-like protein
MPLRAHALLAAVTAASFGLLGFSFVHGGPSSAGWLSFIPLVALVVAADRLELFGGRFYDMRVATVPMVVAFLVLPPAAVMLCGAAFALHRLGSPLDWRQRLFNGTSHSLTGLAAWGTVQVLPIHHTGIGAALAARGLIGTFVYALSSWGLLLLMLHLVGDLGVAEMRQRLPSLLIVEIALGCFGIVIARLWEAAPALVPLEIVPLLLIWSALQISELREEAKADAKTGLANARHLREVLAHELDRADRYGRPLSLLVADLDFLREVNNSHGHLAGDAVLKGIADVLRTELRDTDIPSRFGGEEFCVVLPETSAARATQLAERVRAAVDARRFDAGHDVAPLHVTVSIGVAAFPADGASDDELLDAADAALYNAKASGRNCVRCAGDAAPAAVAAG